MGDFKNPKKRILLQMFDVRPTEKDGNLDLEKIENLEKVLDIFHKEKPLLNCKRRIFINGEDEDNIRNISVEFKNDFKEDDFFEKDEVFFSELPKTTDDFEKNNPEINFGITSFIQKKSPKFLFFGRISLIGMVLVLVFVSANSALKIKKEGMVKGGSAIADLALAKDDIKRGNFDQSYAKFSNASQKLGELSDDLGILGGSISNFTKYIPFFSKLSSGSNIIKSGKNIGDAGKLISEMLKELGDIKSGSGEQKDLSYLELFRKNETKLKEILSLLKEAEVSLDNVNLDDIPEENRNEFLKIKKQLPIINNNLEIFLSGERILVDILGGNGPRKYLFLFQNNQEMRATGGFIGSYGVLDIFNGRVRNFFIDGIFNPDGQLRDKVVPPIPIQKISAAWSLHDSNWFPNFPTSAEKAAWFYEKTGGPTVDGVITMTPTVIQKLLEITGPIEMPEYGVTVDENNFIEKIQYEVEVDYDKELNQPKKILSDLAPKVLDKIFNSINLAEIYKTANILLESLNEKQILIYSKNWEIEKVLSENNWSGEILDTPNDYLSVINTNINGFKTDGVIDENISHEAKIENDGTITDTVTIVRKHNGGDTPYEWWNKVNADYLRVYVPKDSILISAEGQTREFNSSPLDYKTLNFKRDPQVQMEEESMDVDEESGTRIYEDSGKTVFANWVYVSPKETVTLKYTYILPFKIDLKDVSSTGTYSLLAQKQSGSLGSKFSSKITYPDFYKVSWQYPEGKGINFEADLKTDQFIGLAFSRN